MNDEELRKEWALFVDAWKIYKELLSVKLEGDCWEYILEKIRELQKAHNTELSKALALAICDEIERRYNNENQNTGCK